MDKSERERQWMKRVDWGRLAPLRMRARSVAEGVYAGAHRSLRRGPGVEFGGHRPYVPGDDLRWIDRHALMRHDRLMVREFETETDRALYLVVDATASMSFRGKGAPGAKVAFAALIAASLARVALSSGDPVSLGWIGGESARSVPPTSGGEAFERIVRALSCIQATGDGRIDDHAFERAIAPIAQRARRGSVIVLLSDLVDLPNGASDQFAAMATAGRRLVAAQVLDPEELRLPYEGTVRLRSLEGDFVVETDPSVTRPRYLQALEALSESWAKPLTARGGSLVRAATDDDPVSVVRAVLRAVAQGVS
jgi:uncharacterized protein (DUF58 family)